MDIHYNSSFSLYKKELNFIWIILTELLTKKVKKKFFTIPYVKSILEKYSLIVNMFNCKSAYSILNSFKNFIKKGKDLLCNQNVVYKISRDDCDASYVDQTKRQLKTRLQEQAFDINKTKSPL